jgi:adenylate cyclase
MGADEEAPHERLKAHQRELVEPKIRELRGRVVNTTGDGMLVEFPSVVDAVRCAAEVQRGMIDRERELPDEQRIKFRIGINLGDVIAEGGDVFGDGVNVAARLEALAEPGCIYISRIVRDQVRDRLDFAFEDLGDQQVKNLARPVRVYRVRDDALDVEKSIDHLTQPPLPDRPSIAVLPFANMSGDPEQEYFADGMVEEITTALSRIRWLFVVARNSSFTYKGQAIDVKQVGRELGVRYVLKGSVRKAGSRMRIAAQLIEARSGRHIWADRFDGSLEDVFDLQDKVAFSVAGVIEPALQSAETARLVARPTKDPTAYDLYLRAHARHVSAGPQSGEALRLLEKAIQRDPQYGPALALAAFCHSRLYMGGHSPLYMRGLSEDPEASKRKAADFARRALAVAGDDPAILANAAYALAYIGEDLGAMMALIDRALALNPSFARGWYISAALRVWAGQLDIAIEHAEKSLRLCPRERVGWTQFIIGAAHFYSRRFRGGDAKVPPRDARGPQLYWRLSRARRLLRPDGTDRRGPRGHRAVTRHNPSRNAEIQPIAQSRAPRALSVGVTPSSRQGAINLSRWLPWPPTRYSSDNLRRPRRPTRRKLSGWAPIVIREYPASRPHIFWALRPVPCSKPFFSRIAQGRDVGGMVESDRLLRRRGRNPTGIAG